MMLTAAALVVGAGVILFNPIFQGLAIAGFFAMLSTALGYWVHPARLLFTAFVGLNLFQSAFTNWCPMMTFPRKDGVERAG
jgi:hypothetical protein